MTDRWEAERTASADLQGRVAATADLQDRLHASAAELVRITADLKSARGELALEQSARHRAENELNNARKQVCWLTRCLNVYADYLSDMQVKNLIQLRLIHPTEDNLINVTTSTTSKIFYLSYASLEKVDQ